MSYTHFFKKCKVLLLKLLQSGVCLIHIKDTEIIFCKFSTSAKIQLLPAPHEFFSNNHHKNVKFSNNHLKPRKFSKSLNLINRNQSKVYKITIHKCLNFHV